MRVGELGEDAGAAVVASNDWKISAGERGEDWVEGVETPLDETDVRGDRPKRSSGGSSCGSKNAVLRKESNWLLTVVSGDSV